MLWGPGLFARRSDPALWPWFARRLSMALAAGQGLGDRSSAETGASTGGSGRVTRASAAAAAAAAAGAQWQAEYGLSPQPLRKRASVESAQATRSGWAGAGKTANRRGALRKREREAEANEDRDADQASVPGEYGRLDAKFYQCDALELAPRLLGKYLCRDTVVLQITEVEAYRPNDSACHGRVGVTARTAPLFGPGGHAYVYLCYGLHVMLNVTADKPGVGAAVLIRACAPVAGLKTIQERRKQDSDKPVLLTGPGKVGQALGLTTDWSSHPLYDPGGLQIYDGPRPESILVGPRVGIDYADAKDVAALWRFAVGGTPWVSAPRNTLRPAHLEDLGIRRD